MEMQSHKCPIMLSSHSKSHYTPLHIVDISVRRVRRGDESEATFFAGCSPFLCAIVAMERFLSEHNIFHIILICGRWQRWHNKPEKPGTIDTNGKLSIAICDSEKSERGRTMHGSCSNSNNESPMRRHSISLHSYGRPSIQHRLNGSKINTQSERQNVRRVRTNGNRHTHAHIPEEKQISQNAVCN